MNASTDPLADEPLASCPCGCSAPLSLFDLDAGGQPLPPNERRCPGCGAHVRLLYSWDGETPLIRIERVPRAAERPPYARAELEAAHEERRASCSSCPSSPRGPIPSAALHRAPRRGGDREPPGARAHPAPWMTPSC